MEVCFKNLSYKIIKAFTLAEVLITLGIIGVVAGMTIPVLMQNIQDAQFKAAMKKNYSIFSGLYERVQVESGSSFSAALGNCSYRDHTCFKNVIKDYLSYVKECDANVSNGICFPSTIYLADKTTTSTYFHDAASAGLVLKDGTSVDIFLDYPDCTQSRGTFTDECGWLTIDVNGLKGPNIWGRDIYNVMFYKDRVRPLGTNGDGYSGSCSTTGYGCTAQYLYQ